LNATCAESRLQVQVISGRPSVSSDIARRCVKTQPTNSPLYDVVLASRNDTAVKLFEKANPVPKVEPPASLFDMLG